jgi:RNA polymerase sigma-70 factor (ECF subfamily)
VATIASGVQPSAVTDDLVARVVAGDRDAFVTIYRAHYAGLRAFAMRLLGCPMAADDLVHDVFEALPRSLSKFRGECTVKSFLYSIAVRSVHNHLRAAQRRRERERNAWLEPRAEARLPDAELERHELARLLTIALDCLPFKQRVAFVLCELEEKSSQDAAEILGENAGTVRAQVFHAKRKLRERLDELMTESSHGALASALPGRKP